MILVYIVHHVSDHSRGQNACLHLDIYARTGTFHVNGVPVDTGRCRSDLEGTRRVIPGNVTTTGVVTLPSVPGKFLARIFMDSVRQKLLTHQCHEQSGFTPKKSTVDRILALRVVRQTFTYLGSVIHSSTSCKLDVNRRLGRAWSAMNSPDEGVWSCR